MLAENVSSFGDFERINWEAISIFSNSEQNAMYRKFLKSLEINFDD